MNREFAMLDDKSIQFGEDVLYLTIKDGVISDIRGCRNLVAFNEVNVAILDALYDYDLTEDEEDAIRNCLWMHFFRVSRSR